MVDGQERLPPPRRDPPGAGSPRRLRPGARAGLGRRCCARDQGEGGTEGGLFSSSFATPIGEDDAPDAELDPEEPLFGESFDTNDLRAADPFPDEDNPIEEPPPAEFSDDDAFPDDPLVRLEPVELTHVPAIAAAAAEDRDSYNWTPVPDGETEFSATVDQVLAERAGAAFQMIDSDHSPFYSARADLIRILLDHG